ncbi:MULTISPECIES: arsenate reductase (glutaredoxin) [unclassified Devosia]|uniref:arsenate reductase (glutaredoxin) n=1 Tax=unclassified Devosia TaxID=196773 RepID=UPI0015524E6D|nr:MULTISPECIES: arsenate reductase (glutaredoxin) [unclassified Devosia]
MSVTIYHNPDCGTSRNTLAMIRQSGVEPDVVEYLKTPPDRAAIRQLVADAGLTLREALRQKGTPFDALGLGDPLVDEEAMLDAIAAHPILLNRPFVVTAKGTRLCRPSELVLEILENPAIGPFTKEDGEVVVDAEGRRVV